MEPSAEDIRRRTQRLVFRCVCEFLINDAARLVAAHDRDFVRAVIHLAITQASRVGPDDAERSISVRAISQSLALPYETTRRKVLELEAAGFCRRVSAQRVAATPSPLAPSEGRSASQAVEAVVADLKALGYDVSLMLPEGAVRGAKGDPPSESTVRNLLDDFILRVLESGVAPHGSMLDALVFTALMHANAEPITQDPTMAWRYAGADTPPPDNLRRPVTIAELAAKLFIPRETMRRRISRMLDLGRCVAAPGGYLTTLEHMQKPNVLQSGALVVHHFGQLLQHLRQEGFDLDAIPPSVSASGAAA
ncbi:hypothetical protein [Phenylobacterium aquaticum]|uniref:hypothetical protein n=1 Tax=Phenylobacterium aquaticum TaxID=1763816 RepID=UPI001F5D4FEE|nr:hypothetical protein [Phenylobacterium aquaticum]MCI3132621.1 hypothetical protein [Phenylobacterium aquaticum]